LRIEIIGVFAQQGTSLLSDGMDRVVMVPAGFATRLMDIDEAGGSILVKAGSGVALDALRDEITQQYRQVRGVRPLEEDDFSINQVDMISSLLDEIFGQVEVGGWFIGIFAILVGCFSIANIMFVSVRERTRIIGVQKAIGAKSSFILMQFLFEAVALCLFGALFALAGVGLLVLGVNAMDLGMELHIRPERILLALGVAVASGLLAGLAPAQQAARMQPVEAMRMGA
jgi:putative ABC transport system permease protein